MQFNWKYYELKRRATVDLDFDFIKKSISDDSIKLFVNQLNTVSDVTITIIGKIEELKQQDYKGKRVHISISDGNGLALIIERRDTPTVTHTVPNSYPYS